MSEDDELLDFMKDATSKGLFKGAEDKGHEGKSKEAKKPEPKKNEGQSRQRRQSTGKQEPSFTKEQFDEFLRTSDFLKTTLDNISSEVKSRISAKILAKIHEKPMDDLIMDDRIQAAIKVLMLENSLENVDYSTYKQWLTDDITEVLKTTGGPGFYEESAADLWRLFTPAEIKNLDPVLQDYFEKVGKAMRSHKSLGSTLFKRTFEVTRRLFGKHEKMKKEDDFKVLAKKITETVMEEIQLIIASYDQEVQPQDNTHKLHFKKEMPQEGIDTATSFVGPQENEENPEARSGSSEDEE